MSILPQDSTKRVRSTRSIRSWHPSRRTQLNCTVFRIVQVCLVRASPPQVLQCGLLCLGFSTKVAVSQALGQQLFGFSQRCLGLRHSLSCNVVCICAMFLAHPRSQDCVSVGLLIVHEDRLHFMQRLSNFFVCLLHNFRRTDSSAW